MNYFNKHLNFYHGIMFHHFHDRKTHLSGQGSINEDDLIKMIKFIGRENILNADDFFYRLKEKKLNYNNVCLTFDDGIKCQYDIALPVLEDLKIKSFFFIYSSLFQDNPDLLEVFRYFRLNFFTNINEFYDEFYKFLNTELENFFNKKSLLIKQIKKKYGYYSIKDIKFRIVRDYYLSKKQYHEIMFEMFDNFNFKPKNIYNKIFINQKNLKRLNSLGHKIGLHSHTHPTLIEKLSIKEQNNEYKLNQKILAKILKIKNNDIKFMSHPCGSYKKNTLEILKSLNVELGFKNIINIEKERSMKKVNNSNLEIARHDHALIMKIMKK